MAKIKARWKDLPTCEYIVKKCKQYGVSNKDCEHIREKAKKIEGILYETIE